MSDEKELTPTPQKKTRLPAVVTPMSLIQQGLAQSASIEQMEKLFDLQLRWEENEAKKAYFQAVAAFKAEAIDIIKNKKVSYRTDKGLTEYNHAELGQILNTVTPLMSAHGLSHHWEYAQDNGKMKVTCFFTHEMGHEKSTSMEGPYDTSGGKNAIQSIGSASSYLERYTFMAITGLASREQDDDGIGSEAKQRATRGKPEVKAPQARTPHQPVPENEVQEAEIVDGPTVTEGQMNTIRTKLTKAGRDEIDLVSFLNLTHNLKINSIKQIKCVDLTAVIMQIDAGSVPKC